MKNHECEQLEAYLADELNDTTAADFLAHLEVCASCRAEADQQAWLDQLLHDAGTITTAAPDVLWEVEDQISHARRKQRRMYGMSTLLAAASLLLAVGLRRDPGPTPAPKFEANRQSPAAPVATFTGAEDVIVIQHESPYPNVTIVQVYPTVDASRRRERNSERILLPATNILRGDAS